MLATRWPPSGAACRGQPVEKEYVFDGPDGKLSLLDLFDGRRQLIVYRAFIEPGTGGDDVPGPRAGPNTVAWVAH